MSPIEQVQSQSKAGRTSFDAALVLMIVTVMAIMGLAAGGVL